MTLLKTIIIILAIIIVLTFVLFMETNWAFGQTQFHFKGFLSDWLYCDTFGQCYQIQGTSNITTTSYEPTCEINNSVECCTNPINNYTTCRNSTDIDKFPEPKLSFLDKTNPNNYDHITPNSIPREDIEISYNKNGELTITFKNHKYYADYTDHWTTDSMKGVFGKGNLLISQINPDSLEIGDMVGTTGVSHQIVGYCEGGYITKGTNSQVLDEECWTADDMVYKYASVVWTK